MCQIIWGSAAMKLSIIIPAYNAEKYLSEACTSLVGQTLQDWECLIVDDGSSDGTATIAQGFCSVDPRFHLLQQKNSGVSAARNKGIEVARGAYLAFLDADDIWEPNTAALFCSLLDENPDCRVTWGEAIRFDTETGEIKPIVWKSYFPMGNPWYDMLIYHYIPISAVCIRKQDLPDTMRFRTDLTHAEDRDFLLRLLKNAVAIPLNKVVLRSRQHEASVSKNADAALAGEIRVMREHLADAALPRHVRRRAESALAFRCAVIMAFTGGQYGRALLWYLKAVVCDPLNINNYLLPIRKISMTLRHALRRIF